MPLLYECLQHLFGKQSTDGHSSPRRKQKKNRTNLTITSLNSVSSSRFNTLVLKTYYDMTDQVLDAENWKLEAEAVVKDIHKHVQKIVVLDNGTNQCIYFNLTTFEGNDYCIELSGHGFRIAGTSHNQVNSENNDYFETPYALLNQISPLFQQSFNNELINKLNDLKST